MILGVGTDIVKIDRINLKLANRILTKNEYALYEELTTIRKQEWLAGRFAAKEAIYKALDKKIPITEIEVLYKDSKPYCKIEGINVFVSISHEKEYAVAYCIIEKQ